MIRAALVGVSGYGRWHLLMAMEQALLGRLKLVGATVINATEQAAVCRRLERQGVRVFGTFEQMMSALEGEIDLLMLPTGIQWHASMTLAGLRAGAHVLVEKPVAATLQDVDEIIAAQAAAKRLVAVGFQDLHVPAAHDIKRRILQGEIGTLRRAVVRGQWPRSSAYYSRNPWAGHLQLEGAWVLDSPVSNAFAHFLFMALFWAGRTPEGFADPAEIDAELYRASRIESFDTASLRVQTAEGVEILFYASHAGQADLAPQVTLIGDAGTITWVYERTYTIERGGRPSQIFPVPDQLDTRLTVLDAVLTRIEEGKGFVVTPETARGHVRLINALHEYFPIVEIPAAHVDEKKGGGGVFRQIRGLDEIVNRAAQRGLLFEAAGAPWAKGSAGARCLRGYTRFGGIWSA
jgi:Predicted dehydrogenases and related proteins